MRFLFTALHPPAGGAAFGGVASWIKTICKEFSALGQECVIMGPGFPTPDGRFDVGVLSNPSRTDGASQYCDRTVSVSHGVVNEERPGNCARQVFTSEEVREFWGRNGVIIRQPIDLDYWACQGRERAKFVFYSYRAKDVFGLDHLSRKLGLEFVWLKNVETQTARLHLQGAALVVASGRAALEAMACGAPTMICDWREYNGGPLVCMNMEKAMRSNYSGRGGLDPRDANMEILARETMAFQEPRAHVERYHDARAIAAQLLGQCLQS